jgi:hypothetical protein
MNTITMSKVLAAVAAVAALVLAPAAHSDIRSTAIIGPPAGHTWRELANQVTHTVPHPG